MAKTIDYYDRWKANHAAQIAARDGLTWDEVSRWFHLLVLELQGEVSIRRFRACLAAATKELKEDKTRAAAAPPPGPIES